MRLEDAKKASLAACERWVRDGQPEADHDLNWASRAVIRAMREECGAAWLLDVQTGKMWLWNGVDIVHNFEASLVFPAHAPETERLCLERSTREYTGTAADTPLVEAIYTSAAAEGGLVLLWS